MIKVSAVLVTSVFPILLASILGLSQNTIEGSKVIDPITSSDKLEKCLNGETKECMAIFGNTDPKVLAVDDIKVLAKDDEIDLGFDVKNYLPKNFNPYSSSGDFKTPAKQDSFLTSGQDDTNLDTFIPIKDMKPINVDAIVVLKDDSDIDLGFNIKKYLPKNFNPYASR